LYITLNILPDDLRINEIEKSLKEYSNLHRFPDAFIVADPGVIDLCRHYAPEVPLHLSTQTGTFNSISAKFWGRHGICRVILPREMTINDIQRIASADYIETEAFIHGAMCVSISGRCLLGAYMAHRHPNFGDCPQPCRLRYGIAPMPRPSGEPDTKEEWYTVEEEPGSGAFILNAKDLNSLSILDRIVSSGVTALKIEGRGRSLHYVASVVKVYRAALNDIARNAGAYAPLPQWSEELDRLDHRPYTTGFYAGEYDLQDTGNARPERQFRVVGVTREHIDGKGFVVDVKNPFLTGDSVSVLSAGQEAMAHDAVIAGMTDANGNVIEKAVTNRLVICAAEPPLKSGDILRKKS